MGRIHSFESFGTVDGPGVRFVVFMQGCPLRCKYCHNPDTWEFVGGEEYSAEEVFAQIKKYLNYIKDGGVTVTGGEPLRQIDFVIELFKKCKTIGLHTAVDTSGIYFQDNEKYAQLLACTDLFLLDIKHIDDKIHQELTGASNQNILRFARYLDEHGKKMWIRHVLVNGYTNDKAYLLQTKAFIDTLNNVEKVEVLPYHKLGIKKYEQLGISYPLANTQLCTKEEIAQAKEILSVKR